MKNFFRYILFFVLLIFFISGCGNAQQLDYQPKVLLVTAHPDDDALFSATIFKTTHLLDGQADLAILTNGEGGYKYSTIGNYIYGEQLDKEETGRELLPEIRKKELKAGGEIVGIENYYFFDQVDDEYSLDVSRPMDSWNIEMINNRLTEILQNGDYDFVFTMMPHPETHAHHKASAILLLRAVQELPEDERPIVLSTTMLRQKSGSTSFEMLEGYPITKIDRSVQPFEFDRTQKFGHKNRLDYNIIANWVIAEHKSQGTMQLLMNGGKVEQYWYYDLNDNSGVEKTRAYFEAVNAAKMYTNPNNFEEDQ